MSKYKDVFEARKLENKKSGNNEITKSENDENHKSRQMEIQKRENEAAGERAVNLGIKVAERRRRFWVGQAKLQGLTISEVIINALSEKFGEPS